MDVWSFGITLLEIINGKIPYKGIPNGSTMGSFSKAQKVIKDTSTIELTNSILRKQRPKLYSEALFDFIKKCLKNVKERPKYELLKKTRFYVHFLELYSSENVAKQLKKASSITKM